MLNKDVLQKTKEILVAEQEELRVKMAKVMEEIKEDSKKSEVNHFQITSVDSWKDKDGERRSARVTFTSISENDFSFEVDLMKGYADKVSIGSSSSSWNMSKEESKAFIAKKLSNLEIVFEMLTLQRDWTLVASLATIAIKKYDEEYTPVALKYYDTSSSIKEVERTIAEMDKQVSLEEAKEFFKEPKWFGTSFPITKHNWVRNVQIVIDKKGNIVMLYGYNFSDKKKISEDILLDLYKFSQKDNKISQYIYDDKQRVNGESYNYFKAVNCFDSEEAFNENIKNRTFNADDGSYGSSWTKITKDEYRDRNK